MAFGAWLQVVAAALAPSQVVRGPVVTQPSTDGAVIAYTAKGATEVVIDDLRRLPQRSGSVVAALTGLRSGLRHRYRVVNGSVELAAGSFRTDPGPTGSFRAAVFGDYGDGGSNETAVARLTASWKPDLTISTGDNVYLFAAGGFLLDSNVFRPLEPLLRMSAFVPALGNHDTLGDGGSAFLGAFALPGEKRWYVQRYGSAAFVVLDSDTAFGPGTPQQRFLEQAVRDTRSACLRFAVFHHPPWSPHSGGIAPGLRRYVVPVLEKAGFQGVLLGHVHSYERARKAGVEYVTVGTGGARIGNYGDSTIRPRRRITGTYGALRLDVSPHRAVGRFIDINGRTRDRFSIAC